MKTEGLKTWPSPRDINELSSFLGFSGYCKRFILDFFKIIKPCNECKPPSAPVLGFAYPRLPYVLHTDASTTGLGVALYQNQEGQMWAP